VGIVEELVEIWPNEVCDTGVEYGGEAGSHGHIWRYEEQGGDGCHGHMMVL